MSNLNTFAEVEKKYASTKPVNGTTTPLSKDVRPLGRRSVKHERVEKVTDDCYILSDGMYDWGYVNNFQSHEGTLADRLKRSPIVWRRGKNGVESIELTNLPRNSTSPSRWRFFDIYLPSPLRLMRKTAHLHYIANATNDAMHMFPRGTNEDFLSITLTRQSHGGWEQTGVVYKKGGGLVDRAAKKAFKPMMDEFYDWLIPLQPIIMTGEGRVNRSEISKDFAVAMFLTMQKRPDFAFLNIATWQLHTAMFPRTVDDKLYSETTAASAEETSAYLVEVLSNESHHDRVVVAKYILAKLWNRSEDTATKFRGRFNSWVNQYCGFTSKVTISGEI